MKKHRNHRPTRAAGAPDTLQRAAAETLGLAAAQAAPTDLPAAANLAAPAIPAAQNAPAGRSPLATLSPATAAQADASATPSPAASNAATPDAAASPSPAPPASNATAAPDAPASPASPDAASPAAQALLQRLMAQAERLRQQDPGFDLGRALRNPRFARLVAAGLDAGEAYDALRQPQLLDEAYRLGIAQGARQAAADYNRSRPVENGAAPAGVVTALDPASLSRQQRQEIRRMVRSGKTVTF